MRKLKTFVAVLMLVFVLGLAAPVTLAGETQGPSITEPQGTPGQTETPPGETQTPPGDVHTPGLTGEINSPGFATWAKIFFQIFG